MVEGDKNADAAAGEEKDFTGLVSRVDDGLGLLISAALKEGADGLQFRLGKVFEQIVLIALDAGGCLSEGGRGLKQLVLAPFQGDVVLLDGTKQVGAAGAELDFH